MMSLPAARIAPLLYPRLLSLRKLLDGEEQMDELPDGIVLTSESLELGGVYLLENGSEALLHLDRTAQVRGRAAGLFRTRFTLAPPQADMVQALLGVGSYDELLRLPSPVALVPREERQSKVLQEVLQKVREREERPKHTNAGDRSLCCRGK